MRFPPLFWTFPVMAFRSLKPYLFDGFYRWCVDDGQTPHIEFTITPDCSLPRPLNDQLGETLTLNVSPQACRNLQIDNDGLSFVARFRGVSSPVFIPLAALQNIYSKESTRTIPLNFTEVSLEPGLPVSSGVPALSVPVRNAPSTMVDAVPAPASEAAPRKRHLALVWGQAGSNDTQGPEA